MNAPNYDALLAAVSRRLLHKSRDLELLARAMRQTLPADILADVWRAQGLAHKAAAAAHPRGLDLGEVPENLSDILGDKG